MMKANVWPTAVPTHTKAQPRGTPKIAPPAIANSAPGNMMATAAMSATFASQVSISAPRLDIRSANFAATAPKYGPRALHGAISPKSRHLDSQVYSCIL